jgi:hypothetical protein
VLEAILKTSLVMVPVAALTAVLLTVVELSEPVIALILLAVCAMVPPLAFHFDPESRSRKD